jgi:hypothetical protein
MKYLISVISTFLLFFSALAFAVTNITLNQDGYDNAKALIEDEKISSEKWV